MVDRDHLEPTYSLIDRILRLSLVELADFGGAKYDGDFSLSLEEAERREHDYVAADRHPFGRRILDLAAAGEHCSSTCAHAGGTGSASWSRPSGARPNRQPSRWNRSLYTARRAPRVARVLAVRSDRVSRAALSEAIPGEVL